MEDFILFFSKIALQYVFQMVKNIQFFGNQRCSLDSATVSIIVVVELTKTQSKAKIQITLLIVRPLHWCKAWHLWIGIFNGYLNDYLGRIWFQSNAEKIFLLACAQNSHYAHSRFWPILAHMCFDFCDGVFFSCVGVFLKLGGNNRGTFSPKTLTNNPKIWPKMWPFWTKKNRPGRQWGSGKVKIWPKITPILPLIAPYSDLPWPPL